MPRTPLPLPATTPAKTNESTSRTTACTATTYIPTTHYHTTGDRGPIFLAIGYIDRETKFVALNPHLISKLIFIVSINANESSEIQFIKLLLRKV